MGLRCGQYFSSLSAQLVVWCLTLCTVVAATAEHAPQQLRTPTETEYTIRNVEIRVSDIFDEPDLPAFYEAANDLKIETRRDVVRRELLFREGDKYDPFAIEESIRNLRTLNFLRKVSIVPTFEGQYVDLRVTVQDTWTLIPQVSLSSGGGDSNTVFGLSESNILGYGKRVEVLLSLIHI